MQSSTLVILEHAILVGMTGHMHTKKLQKLRTFHDDSARVSMHDSDTAQSQTLHKIKNPPRGTDQNKIPQSALQTVNLDVPPDKKTIRSNAPVTQKSEQAHHLHNPSPKKFQLTAPAPKSTSAVNTEAVSSNSGAKLSSPDPRTSIAGDLDKIRTHKNASILTTEDDVFEMTDVHETSHEGSIITDTKRDRFNLFKEIKNSFTEWLFEKKEGFDEYSKPKHTVTPAFVRKDVIERAAAASASTPRDDHHLVANRLQQTPRTKTVQEVSIKEASEVPKPTWEHITGTHSHAENSVRAETAQKPGEGKAVPQPIPTKREVARTSQDISPIGLSAAEHETHVTKTDSSTQEHRTQTYSAPVFNIEPVPENTSSPSEMQRSASDAETPIAPVPDQFVPESSIKPAARETENIPDEAHIKETEELPQITLSETPDRGYSSRTDSKTETVAEQEFGEPASGFSAVPPEIETGPAPLTAADTAQESQIFQQQTERTAEAFPEPTVVKATTTAEQNSGNVIPSVQAPIIGFQQSNVYSFVIVGIVAAVFGIGTAAWLFFDAEQTSVIPAPEIAPLISADSEYAVPRGDSHRQLITNLASAVTASRQMSITTVQPTIMTEEGIQRPATAAEILSVFNPRAPGSFIRGITDIEFGTYRSSEPYIILKVTSFDTALAGMLAWEPAMSGDLAPFFGEPVISTFDPTSRTATQTRDPFFIDIVHANRDMRVLRDSAQNDRIVYSLLNRTTILISTDTAVIEALAPLVR